MTRVLRPARPIAPVDDFRAEGGSGDLLEHFRVGKINGESVGDGIEMLQRHFRRHFVSIGDTNRMNSPIEQLLGVLQQGAGENDDARRAIT